MRTPFRRTKDDGFLAVPSPDAALPGGTGSLRTVGSGLSAVQRAALASAEPCRAVTDAAAATRQARIAECGQRLQDDYASCLRKARQGRRPTKPCPSIEDLFSF